MKEEMKSSQENDVWDLVELPRDRKAVGSKWVFKVKTAADGSPCGSRFFPKYGLDYDETFCPVVRPESIRTMTALAVKKGLKLHQMDVTIAFLDAEW